MSTTELGQKILELRSRGYSYNSIVKELGCSKSSVCYHCGHNQKTKNYERTKTFRLKAHPFYRKLHRFVHVHYDKKSKVHNTQKETTDKKLIYLKIRKFFNAKGKKVMNKSNPEYQDLPITVDDLLETFGENPKCYITGDPIDINKPRTYQFDHIVPKSRGGLNSIENLGLVTKRANTAKNDMTYDELINFCRKVINYHEQKNKNS